MNTKVLKNIFGLGLVVAGLLFFTWFFGIHQIAKLPLGSYHAWRQADCISLTHNFYDGPSTILQPRTHYAKDDGTGLAVGEFPLLNFFVAKVYQAFGKSTTTYRSIVFLFYITGIIFLYFLFVEVSAHALLSALMSLLIGSGSVLVYYAINFLPDVPAFSIGIAGLYVVTLAKRKNRFGLYSLGLLLITLACLMKLTIGILLGSITVVLFVEILMHGKKRLNIQALVLIGFLFLIVLAWYVHAYRLDHHHPPFVFLTETRSYWQTYFQERPLVWHAVVYTWLPQVFLPIVWIFIGVGGVISFFFSKKVNIETVLFTCVCLFMAVVFFIMMYRQFYLHDYLWVGLLPVLVLVGMACIQGITGIQNKLVKISLQLLMVVLLVLQVFQTKLILKERYFQFDNRWVFNQDLWELKTQLREHGIKKTDKVISIPDASPNITLVVMDQYGFTNYRDRNKDSVGMMRSIQQGAEYLVVSDEKEYEKTYLKPFLKYFLFDYKDIGVFDLRTFRKE